MFEDQMMDSMDNITSVSSLHYSNQKSVSMKLHTRCLPVIDPVKEAEIIESIDAAYYIEENFNATDYELKKLVNTDILPEDLTREMDKLKQQLQVVSKRISSMIIANSVSYAAHLNNIDEIHFELGDLLKILQEIRRNLGCVKNKSGNDLEILANYRNKKFLGRLKNALNDVKTLYETEFQLKDLIQEERYTAAITLCKEAEKAAYRYRQFNCIRDLTRNLCDVMKEIEMSLDNALASLTLLFDPDRYMTIYNAYQLINKAESIGRKTVDFTQATLANSAGTVLLDYVIKKGTTEDVDGLTYEELCERIDPNSLVECVQELGLFICKILSTYHSIIKFHMEEDERLHCSQNVHNDVASVQKVMLDSLYSIFKTAALKFNTLLCCQEFSALKFDAFLDVIEMSNRFKKFGFTYFGYTCGEITLTLEKHAYLYFGRYHNERISELKMFLENEAFAHCPLPIQFTVFDLQEFGFVKGSSKDDLANYEEISDVDGNANLGEQLDFDLIPADFVNPFVSILKADNSGAVLMKEVNPFEMGSASNISVYDVRSDECQRNLEPISCNTAINLLRFFGHYLRMAFLLRSVAEQAFVSIVELYNLFLYTICDFFSKDGQLEDKYIFSEKLSLALETIRDEIFALHQKSGVNFGNCHLSDSIHKGHPDELFALSERIVAVESLFFLNKQLLLLRPVFESLLRKNFVETEVDDFYSKRLIVVDDIRRCIYGCVGSKVLRYPELIGHVSSTKWDINELQSHHSSYVDFLLQEMENFKVRFQHATQMMPIPRDMQVVIWDVIIFCSFRALLQGYSESGKKCSNEGRALMQLDLLHTTNKIEQLTGIQPVPHKAYVEDYIKAYYLPESSLEQWIQQHDEYKTSQIITLLNVATHVSKKARSRIINALEESIR